MKLIPGSNSQSGQESMVLSLLEYKKFGTYLEIGAWDGIDLSNTYLLESMYSWSGLAIDIESKFVKRYNKLRSNPCIKANALTIDYEKLMDETGFPEVIDYLQLDIEPAVNTFNCLLRIPFDKYNFRIITYEHDLYASKDNQVYKDSAYMFLQEKGYLRIASNVMNQGNPFEDWYVNPEYVNPGAVVNLAGDVEFTSHFYSQN
jgi:hypothetical protein